MARRANFNYSVIFFFLIEKGLKMEPEMCVLSLNVCDVNTQNSGTQFKDRAKERL